MRGSAGAASTSGAATAAAGDGAGRDAGGCGCADVAAGEGSSFGGPAASSGLVSSEPAGVPAARGGFVWGGAARHRSSGLLSCVKGLANPSARAAAASQPENRHCAS
jgi:hypothetical protein